MYTSIRERDRSRDDAEKKNRTIFQHNFSFYFPYFSCLALDGGRIPMISSITIRDEKREPPTAKGRHSLPTAHAVPPPLLLLVLRSCVLLASSQYNTIRLFDFLTTYLFSSFSSFLVSFSCRFIYYYYSFHMNTLPLAYVMAEWFAIFTTRATFMNLNQVHDSFIIFYFYFFKKRRCGCIYALPHRNKGSLWLVLYM